VVFGAPISMHRYSIHSLVFGEIMIHKAEKNREKSQWKKKILEPILCSKGSDVFKDREIQKGFSSDNLRIFLHE
jgi:hypothetical protein